jgi:hypothetical protein
MCIQAKNYFFFLQFIVGHGPWFMVIFTNIPLYAVDILKFIRSFGKIYMHLSTSRYLTRIQQMSLSSFFIQQNYSLPIYAAVACTIILSCGNIFNLETTSATCQLGNLNRKKLKCRVRRISMSVCINFYYGSAIFTFIFLPTK